LGEALEDAVLFDEWTEVDRLRGKKWAAEVLHRRRLLVEKLAESQKVAAAAKVAVTQDSENLKAFDEKLMPRMKNRRPLLLRRFHGLIRTPDGEIRIFNKKKVLDMEDADSAKLLEVLDSTPAGRKAVRIKKELDKEALKQLSERFIRSLEPLKVSVGQMFYVSIKSAGERTATNVVRERRKK